MSDIWKIVVTSLITAGATNYFGYIKERKFASSRYTEKVLVNLYIPVYKLLESFSYDPYVGYVGMSKDQFWELKEVIDKNPELVDPKLETFIYNIIGDIYNVYQDDNFQGYGIYDKNGDLYNYVMKSFNITRKSMGLPYDKYYASRLSFFYKVIRNIKNKRTFKRVMKNINK